MKDLKPCHARPHNWHPGAPPKDGKQYLYRFHPEPDACTYVVSWSNHDDRYIYTGGKTIHCEKFDHCIWAEIPSS